MSDDFYEKFKNQIENLGKDGVVGIVKTTEKSSPINAITHQQLIMMNYQQQMQQMQQQMMYTNYMTPPPMYNNNNYNYFPQINNNYNAIANNGAYILYNKPQTQPIPQNANWNNNMFNMNNNHYPSIQNQFYADNNINNNNINNNNINSKTYYEYKPYTLKDYKEINRVPITLGKLGPNIGTREWDEKRKKMKRLIDYSKQVNKQKKGLNVMHTEKIDDIIEKEKMNKIEKSLRNRTLIYGQNLLREKTNIKQKIPNENSVIKRTKTESFPLISPTIKVENNNEDNQSKNIEYLISKNENYNTEINKIKQSLLK